MSRLAHFLRRHGALVTGGLAIIFGVLAYAAVGQYLRELDVRVSQQTEVMEPIVVAAREIPPQTHLSRKDVETTDWPRSARPVGAVTDVAQALDRYLLVGLAKGQPVMASHLAPVGASGGLSALIPEGMRAISVPVDEVTSVNAFITPRSRVDVLVAYETRGRERIAETLLEDVLVLAADRLIEPPRDIEKAPENVSTVTLAVWPEEAEKLVAGRAKGKLHLALRQFSDASMIREAEPRAGGGSSSVSGPVEAVSGPGESLAWLEGEPSEEPVHRVEILRGNDPPETREFH